MPRVEQRPSLDPGLDILAESLEVVHVGLLGGPLDAQTLSIVRLRDLCHISKSRSFGVVCVARALQCGSEPRDRSQQAGSIYADTDGVSYVVNLLVGNVAVVLEDVVVRDARGDGNLLESRLGGHTASVY